MIEELSRIIVKRQKELFLPDIVARREMLRENITGKRVLIVGGAGSIGSATVQQVSLFRPAALHVVDLSENSLVELVRTLRSDSTGLNVRDFRALPLDFGSPVMQRFLHEAQPYDLVFNFAALKHVRSEKDVYSALQLIETNIIKAARFLGWLVQADFPGRYFCVSTDKAANPVNLMGASKRIMEQLIFSADALYGRHLPVTTARFPNVAFSDGSLLHGFLNRLRKAQPLAVPENIRRFFITQKEAGQLCLLAAVSQYEGHVIIPRLEIARDSIELQSVAEAVLRYHGYEPRIYRDEGEARENVGRDRAVGRYPLFLSSPNTSGEKLCEEFVAKGETVVEIDMETLLGVRTPTVPSESLETFLRSVEECVVSPSLKTTKQDLVAMMLEVVPELVHYETGRNLDEGM